MEKDGSAKGKGSNTRHYQSIEEIHMINKAYLNNKSSPSAKKYKSRPLQRCKYFDTIHEPLRCPVFDKAAQDTGIQTTMGRNAEKLVKRKRNREECRVDNEETEG